MPRKPASATPETSRYSEMAAVLEACRAEAQERELTLGEVLDRFGEASYSFVCLLLALPFLQPISLGPLSTLGGLNFAALGWQLARGRQTPWVPERLRRAVLPPRVWSILLGVLLRLFRICHRFTRPRGQRWVSGRRGELVGGSLIALGGLLISIPLAGIPFNNLLPALVIVFVCIGELEGDGAMVWVALFWLVVSVAYLGFVAWALFFLGSEAFGWFGRFLGK